MKLGFKQVFVVYLKKNPIGPHVETVLWWAIYDWHENHTLCRELFFDGPFTIGINTTILVEIVKQ